jgi:hypothetical protein
LRYNRQIPTEEYITKEQMNIIINSQRLWLQLVFGIRSLLLTVLRDPERTESAANQLYGVVSNSFYSYLRFFYGPAAAQQFVNILSDYITSMWRVFEEIGSNSYGQTPDSNTAALYNNADQLAAYLAGLNVYWSEEQWKSFFNQLTQLLIQEAVTLATKDFNGEYQIFQRIVDLSTLMGDYMARGIIASSSAPATPQGA